MNFSSDTIELFSPSSTAALSGAARALGRVPSAVSMGIANLEAELGFALSSEPTAKPVLRRWPGPWHRKRG